MSKAPQRVVATAPGKINLSLRVGGADERGYHALATVFHAVDLLETLEAQRPARPGELALTVDSRVRGDVPVDASNLALRAAELLRRETGTAGGATLHITKRVPIAGGMGGGSADAAAALVALNRLWQLDLPTAELMRLGAELGADVPFALLGGTALGTGTGTVLEPLESAGQCTWLLVTSDGHLSTPRVYATFDEQCLRAGRSPAVLPEPDQEQIRALRDGDPQELAATLANDLQAAACELDPRLRPALETAAAAGALGGLVSGSGPTLVFLAADGDHAAELAEHLRAAGHGQDHVITTGPARGARVVAED